MASNSSPGRRSGKIQYSADEIARLSNGSMVELDTHTGAGHIIQFLSREETNKRYRADHDAIAKKVAVSALVLVVLAFFSLSFMGAAGQYYSYSEAYAFYTPVQTAQAIGEYLYNSFGDITHWYTPHTNQWLADNMPWYWAVGNRAGVVGITLVCAVLVSVSGMLYQNVFKNPLASAGMLGASSGVSLGMMILVALYSATATTMINERYLYCYGCGAAILVFVIVAGKKLSGKGRPFDIVTMLLIGSIIGQLLGFVTMYITLFVMDETDYQVYYTLSQMLTVDTSLVSWVVLTIAAAVSIVPVYLLRFRMNALAFEEAEVRLFGLNYTLLRSIALICGAIMLLAASIHTGSVGMIALIGPFLARGWFGCEFSKQFTGSICLSTILLLIARDITDCIPFVGDGFAIGSVMSIAFLPLFILISVRYMRGWGEE